MWEISSFSQISASFFAFLLGIALSLFYDIIKATRKIGFNSYFVVFLGDIFFSLLSAIITFLFLLIFTNGALRAFVLFFQLFGFIISRITISRYFLKLLVLFFTHLKKVFIAISLFLLRFSYKTEGFLLKINLIIKKSLKKLSKRTKKS